MSLSWFSLEHIHPILVNFTAALLPASLATDVLGRMFRRQSLHEAASWMLIYAAGITPLTAIAGFMWKNSVGEAALPRSVLLTHQWLGISLAIFFVGLALWRWKIHALDETPGLPYLVSASVIVSALVYQGALGGRMAFG